MGDKAREIVFTDEQKQVIGASGNSDILVVAGAGSGKTTTMTQRIIKLITQDGVSPHHILGLTFTKKAAAELRVSVNRAVEAQRGELRDSISGLDDAKMALSGMPSEVYTYDAFFQQIVRQYGLLVGMGPSVTPLSEAGRYQLASEVVRNNLDSIIPSSDIGNSDDGSAVDDDDDDSDSEASPEVKGFATYVGDILALSDSILSFVIDEESLSFEDAADKVDLWDRLFIEKVTALLSSQDSEVLSAKPKKITAAMLAEGKDEKAEKTRLGKLARMRQIIEVTDAAKLLKITRRRQLTLELARKYAQAKKERGLADFSDFTVAAFQLVQRFPLIGQQCRSRYTHVFLDEYQDTSTTQAKLIAALFHPLEGSASSLTAVGDPFQSIYAWRGASPGSFSLFKEAFGFDTAESEVEVESGLKNSLSLSASMRNPQLVLDAANMLTMPLRDQRSSDAYEVQVKELTSRGNLQGTVGVLEAQSVRMEAKAVAVFAQEAVRKYSSADSQNGAEKTAGKKTHVAVLVRRKKLMDCYRAALEERGLSVEVVGISSLLSQPEVADVMSLLRSVTDRSDSSSVMRLLASPRFGLGAVELEALAKVVSDLNEHAKMNALAATGVEASPKKLPNSVFLIDVLLEDDLENLLKRSERFSPLAMRKICELGSALSKVEAVLHASVQQIIHTAVESLDIDIDMAVAQAVDSSGARASARSAALDSVISLVDSYASELPDTLAPSLLGFLAWVDAAREDKLSAFGIQDSTADVVLMTVHQAKGLEWDAVAVVGMSQGKFPSNNGDHLKVSYREESDGSFEDGYEAGDHGLGAFTAHAQSWIEQWRNVPVPVRADAQILPRFPHGCTASQRSSEEIENSLSRLDSLEALEKEVFGLSNLGRGAGEDALKFASMTTEYGERIHADERRLAYVALTRARHDVLLTNYLMDDSDADPSAGVHDIPVKELFGKSSSIFLRQVRDFLLENSARQVDFDINGLSPEAPLIGALFLGENSSDYQQAFEQRTEEYWFDGRPVTMGEETNSKGVTTAHLRLEAPREQDGRANSLVWPMSLSGRTEDILCRSAQAVWAVPATGTGADSSSSSDAGGTAESGRGSGLRAHALKVWDEFGNENDARAAMTSSERQRSLRERVESVQKGRPLGVTSLRARVGALSQSELEQYYRGVLRPLPPIPSRYAEFGTLFHRWVQLQLDGFGLSLDETMTEASAVDLDKSSLLASDKKRFALYQSRFLTSRWARRNPLAVEMPVEFELGELFASGVIDAVFSGRLDDSPEVADRDGEHFTVVDWKTGHKPSREDEAKMLSQLDMYRIAWSFSRRVPLENIDAALYYFDEPDESLRQIPADSSKTLRDIVGEIRL
jgi:DNA helicase-2/ATP-dependent DNA helicase PcrA